MIEGTYRVYIIDAFFASDDAALLAGLIPPDDGELASSQELLVVEVRVPSANRRLDDGQISFVRLLGGLLQELVDRGTVIAANTPKMAMTTTNSTRVNPFCALN
jgi:hypothetical protein